ncbi:MAG: hypothetical protein RR061_08750 [Muribaculaceae bacterium]
MMGNTTGTIAAMAPIAEVAKEPIAVVREVTIPSMTNLLPYDLTNLKAAYIVIEISQPRTASRIPAGNNPKIDARKSIIC